jgi:hypothetical protein
MAASPRPSCPFRQRFRCLWRRSAAWPLWDTADEGQSADGPYRAAYVARAIRDGGGNGSIIGRNSFQRPRYEALELLGKLVDICSGKA